MKKPTKIELEQSVASLQTEVDLLRIAMHHLYNDAAEHTEQFEMPDGWRYRYELFGSNRACGGIVVESSWYGPERKSISVYYAENIKRTFENAPLNFRVAADNIIRARNYLCSLKAA
jgi:hypothetical protein